MPLPCSVSLPCSGAVAELSLVDEASASYLLTVDGIPQSQVCFSDATRLEFDYVRHIARMVDVWAAPGEALPCIHLGGGGLSLARYVEATRPGSQQLVIDSQRAMVEGVLEVLPLAAGHATRLLFGDARELAERLVLRRRLLRSTAGGGRDSACSGAMAAGAGVVVIDLWEGSVIPSHVATLEFYLLVAQLAAPEALVVVNLLDRGPGFDYSRGQAATLRRVWPRVGVLRDPRSMLGCAGFCPEGSAVGCGGAAGADADSEGFGNVVLVASRRRLDFLETSGWLRDEPRPPHALSGPNVDAWVAGAPAMTDEASAASPRPPREALSPVCTPEMST
ncbi:fused MFS/spermidine synthase [Subtercola frigoramans]